MKTSASLVYLLFHSFVFALTPPHWNFQSAYESSKDVFVAEVIEVETSLEIESDQVGKNMKTGEVVRIVWPNAKRFKLSVKEVFKGEQPTVFDVYNCGVPELRTQENYQGELSEIWIYDGKDFGSLPKPVLKKGTQYLFS